MSVNLCRRFQTFLRLFDKFDHGHVHNSGASIGYQKRLLSIKVMMSQIEPRPWFSMGSFGHHGDQWVNQSTGA